MKLTAAANGAIRVLMACDEDRLMPMSEMAARLNMAEPTVVKTCHELMQAGYIEGRRGRNGGYRLARSPRAIGVLDVIDLFEPPEEMFPCRFNQAERCRLVIDCSLRLACEKAYQAFRAELTPLKLGDLGHWSLPPAERAAPQPAAPAPNRRPALADILPPPAMPHPKRPRAASANK